MKVQVKVKAGSKTERFEKIDDTHFVISVRELPVEGRANAAVIAALAKHFAVPRKNLALVHGHRSRHKIVEVTL